jgi:mono/diheme cytochrome c family protein
LRGGLLGTEPLHWNGDMADFEKLVKEEFAAERGKELFESEAVRCSQCHAGSHLTNNQTANVGTGADLQVPSLKGVRFRTPLMHDGCAATISERFSNTKCGGGDKHGTTSQLSAAQLSDLTAYVETL